MKNTLVAPYIARAGMACLLAVGLALAGCGSNPDRDRPENPFKKQPGPGDAKAPLSDAELHVEADQLYRRAHESVVSSDWTQARDRLNKLIARYPFSDYATQAEMEKIYVGFKGGQPDEALADADRFLRAHPRSSQAEYVQYLKGVINYSRDEGLFETLGINNSPRKDVSNVRRAYDDFALLLQRYPNSKYCGDARRRMVFLRNRIADHDLTVAQYYFRRGAYIAAAARAQSVITEYPGAPASVQALLILEKSYRLAGLTEQADDAAHIIAANANNKPFTQPRPAALVTTVDEAPPARPLVIAPAAQTKTGVVADTKPSLSERFFHLFDIFEPSRPEHQYTVVVPSSPSPSHVDTSGSSVPATPKPATTDGSATPTSTTAPTDSSSKPSGFKLKAQAPGSDDSTPDSSSATPPKS